MRLYRVRLREAALRVQHSANVEMAAGTDPYMRMRTPDDSIRYQSTTFALIRVMDKAVLLARTVRVHPGDVVLGVRMLSPASTIEADENSPHKRRPAAHSLGVCAWSGWLEQHSGTQVLADEWIQAARTGRHWRQLRVWMGVSRNTHGGMKAAHA